MRWYNGVANRLSNAYIRVTLTRYHFLFFLVTFLHCAALVFLQSITFVINEEARDFMVHVMSMTGATRDAVAVVVADTLFLCQHVPGSGLTSGRYAEDFKSCLQVSPPPSSAPSQQLVAVNATVDEEEYYGKTVDASLSTVYNRRFQERSLLYPTGMTLVPDIRAGTIFGMSIVGIGNSTGILDENGNLWVSHECIASLRYPEQEFQDAGRENISFLFFHVWVFAISILAIVNESVPHLASALAGQCLAAAWAAWDIYRTIQFRRRYEGLISDTLCSGANLIPHYWPTRNRLTVSIASINFGMLALTFWLTMVLIRMFSTSQFRSVGAAPMLEKLYRVLMAFSTVLRLYIFFLVLTTTLWLDQLDGGLLHTFLTTSQFNGYLGICSIALILALPLVFLGDTSVRTERRHLALGFLVAQSLYVGFHASLLASSAIYRWTLILWPFFAVNVAASFILAFTSLVLGILCRINFGRGLDHFIHVTSILERDGFTHAFMTSEQLPSKKHARFDSVDSLLESGDTVKVSASYHRQSRFVPSKLSIPKRKRDRRHRDSTESFGHTTHVDPNFDFIDEKNMQGAATLDHVQTNDSIPVFDNREAVRAPDPGQEIASRTE
ncbi:hypothetical protein BKA62DRAFT_686060 [Auriculariales sp. MPI-PUGE-AT-0066]|nr:hypothetical protein BKA62DRAFT_686060 [Auriculariales sp. MPI-PUGE-AT-0066]